MGNTMKSRYLYILLVVFISCQSKSDENSSSEGTASSVSGAESISVAKAHVNGIEIADSSDYSADFIDDLHQTGVKDVRLIGDMFIQNGGDTVYFPQYPVLGREIVLAGKKADLEITLTVRRINQTTIDYKVEMMKSNKERFSKRGQANIYPQFYLGSESDESDISGIAYMADQYEDINDSCYTYIRLGKEEDSGSQLLGKLIMNCNGKIHDIDLDNFPTLIEK